jgi:hypothetical protein
MMPKEAPLFCGADEHTYPERLRTMPLVKKIQRLSMPGAKTGIYANQQAGTVELLAVYSHEPIDGFSLGGVMHT